MLTIRLPRLPVIILGMTIVVVGLSPRLPVDTAVLGRSFDLRIEDFFAVLITIWAVLGFFSKRALFLPLKYSLGFFMFAICLSNIVAVSHGDVNRLRLAAYFSKQVEYFVFFFYAANVVKTEGEIKFVMKTCFFTGLLNGSWVLFQFFTGQRKPLFHVAKELVYGYQQTMESYGPNLIGESSPFLTGGFFLVMSLLALAAYLYLQKAKRTHMLLFLLFAICLGLSYSRSSVLALGVGAFLLFSLSSIRRKIWLLVALAAVTPIVLNTMSKSKMISRFGTSQIESASEFRRAYIWKPIIDQAMEHPLLGAGQGLRGEAHNHYLRVFAESGGLGLLAFLLLLGRMFYVFVRLFLNTSNKVSKTVSGAALALLAGMCASAVHQEAFLPVLLNELFWILCGLAIAAQKMEPYAG